MMLAGLHTENFVLLGVGFCAYWIIKVGIFVLRAAHRIMGLEMATPPAPSPAQASSWLPIVYTAFGAFLGFILTRWKDWLDERKMQKRFFAAVHAELIQMNEHFEGTLRDATENEEKLDKGERRALHLLTKFQRGVYDSQIGKLKDVSDQLLIEIIQFYDKLSNLESVKARFTSISFDLTSLTETQDDNPREGPLVMQYRVALDEIIKRINELRPVLLRLIAETQSM